MMTLGSAATVIAAALSLISLDYSRRISELATTSPDVVDEERGNRVATRLGLVGRAFCRTDEERAGFDLMGRYMHRDRKLRMRIYPAFGLPLAVYLFGLVTKSFSDPFGPRSIEPGFPILAVAPDGPLFDDMLTLLDNVTKQRYARSIAISNRPEALETARYGLALPVMPEWLSPIVSIVPAQLFCKDLAKLRGLDTENPRGLSKVTLTT